MLLLYLILKSISASLLQDLNTIYENLRYQSQYLITQTPKNMIDSTFGFKPELLDLQTQYIDEDENDFGDEVSNEDFQKNLIRKADNRILDQDQSDQQTNQTTIIVDEYYKQGPLHPIYCGLGQSILLNVTQFYCSKKRATKNQYDLEANSSQCEKRYRLSYGCLCPPDFYDLQCLKWNQIICEMNQPTQDCQTPVDENYYNQNIDGNPPCFELQNEQSVENIRVVCRNFDQSILHPSVQSYEESFEVIWSNYSRGISALSQQMYKHSLPNPQNPNDPQFYIQFALSEEEERQIYKYDHQPLFLDTVNLKSSLQFTLKPYITYINWTNLAASKSTLIEQNLTHNQVLGNQYISVKLNNQNMESLFGRYSLEIGLIINITHYFSIYKYANQAKNQDHLIYKPQFEPTILFFEDFSYNEPKLDTSLNKSFSIEIVAIILFILVSFCIFLKYRFFLHLFRKSKVNQEQNQTNQSPRSNKKQ